MKIRTAITGATLLLAAAANAAPPPALSTGYSANRRIESDQGVIEGSIVAAPGMERSEMRMGGMSTVTILRSDRGKGWMLMPAQKMYQELDLRQAAQQAGTVPQDQVDLEQVGTETIEGLATTKYKFVMKDGSAGGFLWYTRDGIPVKMDLLSKSGRRNSRITVTLENVQVGEQDPSLFELPAGYTQLPGGMINLRR
jgi:hypothetical protein